MTIEKALLAIQDFGFTPDNAEIMIIFTPDDNPTARRGINGVWYDDEILKWSTKEAISINISVDADEVKITAIF